MKIGFRTAGFHQWPIDEALRTLAELGYDGVEICLEHPDCRPEKLTRADAANLARKCREVGLEVASVSYHADSEEPNLRRDSTIRALDLVAAFGADIFIINGRRMEPGQEAEARSALSAILDQLLPKAADCGLRVAIEPEPGLSVGSSGEMHVLLDSAQSPALAVNLDVGHAFLTDDDVCESIRKLGSAIVHTHVEGMSAGIHRHLLPGEGDLDLVGVCHTLSAIGYRGYYTIDLFNIADDPAGWAAQALDAMRTIAAEVGA